MNGLEIAERFYREYGAPMLREQFPEWEGKIAVGLCGSGSECLGYDDERSRDHDFEPGFCLFIPEETEMDSRTAFRLERAYSALPREFLGLRRLKIQPAGGARHGVIRRGDFWEQKTGSREGVLSLQAWLRIPEQYLLEATNGKIFRDDEGSFSAVRARLAALPEPVRLKKLAGRLFLAYQAGSYNLPRAALRGDEGASALCAQEFARHAVAALFLIHRHYLPYYKWVFRALRELPGEEETAALFLRLWNEPLERESVAKQISGLLCERLCSTGLLDAPLYELERCAYRINDQITDPTLRCENILMGVDR